MDSIDVDVSIIMESSVGDHCPETKSRGSKRIKWGLTNKENKCSPSFQVSVPAKL